MSVVAEASGSSIPCSSTPPSADRRRDADARRAGEAVVEMLRRGITSRDIMTKSAFENAIAVVQAFGGSTNAVLDRKSTRLNSSHVAISYAVFCVKKERKG